MSQGFVRLIFDKMPPRLQESTLQPRDPAPHKPEGPHSPAPAGVGGAAKGWTFLTNHAHVLLAIARNSTVRLRDVADSVGITERAAQGIVRDLEGAGYLQRERVGRRNQYVVNPAGRFRHPAESDRRIGELLVLFTDTTARDGSETEDQ